MRLQEECEFSTDNVADMASLQEDVDVMFEKSLESESPSPKLFVSYLIAYFDNRPKIVSSLTPSSDFDTLQFSKWMAKMHLKARTVRMILEGEITDKETIMEYKDDLRAVMNMMNNRKPSDTIGIARKKTGIVLRDTIEDTRKELEEKVNIKKAIDSKGVALA